MMDKSVQYFQATEFPCHDIANSNGERRLHTRVAPSILSSANVERKGVGPTKVSNFHEDILV